MAPIQGASTVRITFASVDVLFETEWSAYWSIASVNQHFHGVSETVLYTI